MLHLSPQPGRRGGPIRELYEAVRGRSDVVIGHGASFEVIRELKNRLAAKDPEREARCTDGELLGRLESVERFSREVMERHRDVEGVTFFGSTLRGKIAPRDCDLKIIVSRALEPALTVELEQISDVGGVRPHFSVETEEHVADFVDFISQIPFVVFSRAGWRSAPFVMASSGPPSYDERAPRRLTDWDLFF